MNAPAVLSRPVLALNRHWQPVQTTPAVNAIALVKRDRHACQYCGAQPGPAKLTIDHILPKSRGERSDWTNCAPACLACNARKANRTPAEAGMALRKAPKKPSWAALDPVPRAQRRLSWVQFLSKAYWEVKLEA